VSRFPEAPCPRLNLRLADDDMEAHTLVKATHRFFRSAGCKSEADARSMPQTKQWRNPSP
jgi:hypothetical protein